MVAGTLLPLFSLGCTKGETEDINQKNLYWGAQEIYDTWTYTHQDTSTVYPVSMKGGVLCITTRANTYDRAKMSTEKIFTDGLYSWKTYIPQVAPGDQTSIGSWIYCDDHHEIDFEVGWGKDEIRQEAKCKADELVACMTCQDFPFTSTYVPITTGWHEFAIRLDLNKGKYVVYWLIDGKEIKTQHLEFGPEIAFKIYVSVENLKFIGSHIASQDNTGKYEWVKFKGHTKDNVIPSKYSDWKLDWSDEFDNDGTPDPSKWAFEEGFVRNKEVQWYQKENAVCKDGILVIEAKNEVKPNPNYEEGSSDWKKSREFITYTSASLVTENLKDFLYGIIEFKARIPIGQAAWPAIWSTGSKMPWPWNGEMDMMEYYKREEGKTLLANFFWTGKNEDDIKDNTKHILLSHFTDKDPDWADKFHVWKVVWDSDYIRIYVDGELLNTGTVSKMNNGGKYEGTNPFRSAHKMRINLALRNKEYDNVNPSMLPYKLEVDYVRYYTKKYPENCCSPHFGGLVALYRKKSYLRIPFMIPIDTL